MADLRRRQFLQNLTALGFTTASLAVCQRSTAAEHRKRSFTVDLTCGAIGVRADGREAIELAHQYGFESVAPSPAFLAKLSADELQKLLADMKAKRLTWGAAGLPVNFRSDESTFLSGMKRLAEFAAPLQRAGANRVGTWLSPTHPSLTYRANFRLHVRRLREVNGKEGPASAQVGASRNEGYMSIRLQGNYRVQKIGIGDLDGDGRYDYVIKQPADNIDPYEKYWTRSHDDLGRPNAQGLRHVAFRVTDLDPAKGPKMGLPGRSSRPPAGNPRAS